MARGGFRPGAGRPKGSTIVKKGQANGSCLTAAVAAEKSGQASTPLEYMLKVMSDADADPARRDRMAIAAAPFMHHRKVEGGKKEGQADAAKKAATGRFGPAAPPLKLVGKK